MKTRAKDGLGWPGKYVRRVYDVTPDGCCYGAAREIEWEQFGDTIPSMIALARAVAAGRFNAPGLRVEKPDDGDFVIMGTEAKPCQHVGVWSAGLRSIVAADDVFGSVLAIDIQTMRFMHPRIEFRRLRAASEAVGA